MSHHKTTSKRKTSRKARSVAGSALSQKHSKKIKDGHRTNSGGPRRGEKK